MHGHSKIALQMALNEKINKRKQLSETAEQYELRAKIIRENEIPEFDDQIRALQADLD